MPIVENIVFKLVSLRGPMDGLTVDPSDDVSDSQVEQLLSDLQVDPRQPAPEVISRVEKLPVLTEAALQRSVLADVLKQLHAVKELSFFTLTSIQVVHGEKNMSLADLSTTDEFANSYRQLTDSWLTLRLLNNQEFLVDQHEVLIRIAHVCLCLRTSPDSLREAGAIDRLLHALVVFPRNWRPARYRQQELWAKYSARLAATGPATTSVLVRKIARKKREHAELVKRIALRESIQSKINALYTQWKKERADANPTPSAGASRPLRRGGLLQIGSNFIFGVQVSSVRSQVTPVVRLDETFYSRLENRLTEDEKGEIGNTLERRPPFFNDLQAALGTVGLIVDANDACAMIKVWEEEETQKFPEAETREPSKDRPSVRAIGWGELIVARERLVGYEANEISDIENILSGEEKVREHERTNTTVQVTETETTKNTETERDLQTTNRFEIQTEAQKTIQQDFSIQAGVNTSGRYGLTEVNTSLDAGFQQNQSESRSSSVQLAKDIVSRAVERTIESIRELRRLTITEQIRELNTHTVKNIPANMAQVNPPSMSGVYLWVEKIHEVELRQYGTRLMVEFHIPEPAVSLLGLDNPEKKNIRKPAPLTIGPNDINQGNYLCLTKLYEAEDVEPPPALFIQVGYTWASTPDEGVNEDTAEDTVSESITIPDGYLPVSGSVIVSTVNYQSGYVDVKMAVGGQIVIELEGKPDKHEEFHFDPVYRWPQGVPVSLRAHGHFDKTLIAHIALRCERTAEAYTVWQLRTWEKIRVAHQVLVREFERAIEEANFSNTAQFQIQGRPEAENRQIEIEELTKWAIKIMSLKPGRLTPFDFNAIVQVGDYPEVDPLDADFQAPIVRFFEEAFEWRQMTYFLYPYFWGRRDAWKLRQQITDPDPRYEAFLRAGAARVIVPVTPGYEERVLYYLESDPEKDELVRISGPDPGSQIPPADSEVEDLWLELLINKNEELALGSGTLDVQKGKTLVIINKDSTWVTSDRDLGRELYIDGDRYTIASISIANKRKFNLNEPYKGRNDTHARYATGSVPYGPPWLVRIPTSLVILSEETGKLAQLP